MREIFGLEYVSAHRHVRKIEGGFDCDFFIEAGPPVEGAYRRLVGTAGGRVLSYDPVRPQPSQRNHVTVHGWEGFPQLLR